MTQSFYRHITTTIILKRVILILVAESEFVLDLPARDVNDYVETATLPTLTKFTFCVWMKRDFDGLLYGALLSYATTQEVQSLELALGTRGAINIRVMDSRYVKYTPYCVFQHIMRAKSLKYKKSTYVVMRFRA